MITAKSKEDIKDLKNLKKQFIQDLKQTIREFRETDSETENYALNRIQFLTNNYDTIRQL